MQNGEKGEFKYRIEAARNLAREGIVTEPVTDDILHVTLGGKRLCWVTDRGDIGYYREGDVEHDVAHGEDAVSAAVLGDKGEAFVDRVRPAVRNKFLAVQTGDAAGASADAEDGLHQLRPPCAHQSHHAKNLPPANLKADMPEIRLVAQVLDFQHRLADGDLDLGKNVGDGTADHHLDDLVLGDIGGIATGNIGPVSENGDTVGNRLGRTEIGGNYTGHQHGHVLCASVDMDMLACVAPNRLDAVRIHSDT